MEYKNELELINTQEKSYLLGMLYADGCITNNNAVKLSLIDKQIIEELHLIFSFFNINEFDFSIYNINSKKQYSLSKKSEKLQLDLISNGLYFKKSTENADKLILPNIEKTLINHFIRGYFDGNGSISIPSKRPNLRRIEICSSSKTLIESFKKYLENQDINCPIYREKVNKTSTLYLLEWVNSLDTIKLREFLYQNSTIHLNRKKELFDTFKIINKTDNNPICICGENLIKNGKRKTNKGIMLRYKCEKCNKHMTIPAQIKSDELLETPKALRTINFNSDNRKDSNGQSAAKL